MLGIIKNLCDMLEVRMALTTQSVSGATADGEDIDHTGFDRALFVFVFGLWGAGGTFSIDITEDEVGGSTYADSLLDATVDLTEAAHESHVVLVDVDLRDSAGQIRCEGTAAVGAVLVGAACILYSGDQGFPIADADRPADVVVSERST